MRIAILGLLDEILRQWRVRFELGVGLPINFTQNFPSFGVDVSHAAQIDGQLFAMQGRSERMPGSF